MTDHFTAVKVLEHAKALQADLRRMEAEMDEKTYWIETARSISKSLEDGLGVANSIIGPLEIVDAQWKEPDCKATALTQWLSDALTNANLLVSQIRRIAEKFESVEPQVVSRG
jgi:hypothetical protein